MFAEDFVRILSNYRNDGHKIMWNMLSGKKNAVTGRICHWDS